MTNATESKKQSEIGDVKDQARLDIVAKQTEKLGPEVTEEELRTILEEYGTLKGEGEILDQILVTKSGYEIPVREIWGGPISSDSIDVGDLEKAIKIIVNSGDDGVVQLPIIESVEIDWGDGNIETAKNNVISPKIASINNDIQIANSDLKGHMHQYEEKNKEYEVTISGNVTMMGTPIMSGASEYIQKIVEIKQWGETGLEHISFEECTNLRKIASPSENSFSKIEDFNGAFAGCTSLTEIPEDLFKNCSNATSFDSTFQGCEKLTNLPENLFSDCINVMSFNATFSDCEGLNSLPENLFANCQKVENFSRTFEFCSNLQGKSLPLWEMIDGWQNLDFLEYDGWSRAIPNGACCYGGCDKLEDYDSIPVYWKSSLPF